MSVADDDFTMGEVFNAMRAASQAKRANNREHSAQQLREAGIAFTAHNGGAHLVVAGGRFDTWPGTGLWKERSGQRRRGRGVRNLIALLKNPENTR